MALETQTPTMGGAAMTAIKGIAGNYQLRIQFGEQDIDWTPMSFTAIEVFEYIDRMLPSFRVTFKDPTGFLTNKLMIDATRGQLRLVFSGAWDMAKEKDMSFRVYRRFAEKLTDVGNIITMTGLLDAPGLFSPSWQRGWSKTAVTAILGQLAAEMKLTNTDFDTFTKPITVVQGNWSNITFLQYLANRLVNSNGAGGMFCFVDVPAARDGSKASFAGPRLTFKALKSFLTKAPVKKFQVTKEAAAGNIPIYNFEVVDNFEVLNAIGIGKQVLQYFDYETGMQKDVTVGLDETLAPSLSKYINCDAGLETDGVSMDDIGRTNDFVKDPMPVVRGKYEKRINSLVQQWVTVPGLTDICCGDIVQIDPAVVAASDLMSHQYTGRWMVSRIVHHISSTYMTKLLLTRGGIDTDEWTTLRTAGTLAGQK